MQMGFAVISDKCFFYTKIGAVTVLFIPEILRGKTFVGAR